MQQFLRDFGCFRQPNLRVSSACAILGGWGGGGIGTTMALPLRGIQGQSNIITCVEQQQKSNNKVSLDTLLLVSS